MSDPTRCHAVEANGEQCICMRADDTYFDDAKRTRCSNCNHIASAHPQAKPSVSSFVRGFRDAAKIDPTSSTSSSIKASQEEATAETSTGLRNTKKRKSDSSIEPVLKKANKGKPGKGKAPKTEGDLVKYGKAVMLPHGVEDGYLRISKAPSHQELQEMRRAKLVVLSSPSQPLSINTSWTNEEVNVEIKRLFPQATEFLRREHSGEHQLWLGATSHKNVVTLAGDPFPTGVELADYCKVLGRPSADRILYIASKHKIAKCHWDWAPPESEDLGSEVDTVPSEDIVFTPPKPRPAYKGKGKAKEVKVRAEPELETDPKALEEEEPDMRQAGKLRTRFDTGVLKRTTLFIPGSSNEPEPDVLDQDVVVVSDDENDELPPLLPWKTQSPSPAPSLAPLSPSHDLPSFFADFTHLPSPPPMETVTATSSASSSVSGPSTTSSVFSGTFSTWTPALAPSTATPASAPLPAWLIPDGGSEIVNVPNPLPDVQATDASGHRFKRMGKGRG